MPRLSSTNLQAWNRALEDVEYYAGWDESIIDIDQRHTKELWNKSKKESAKRQQHRRTAHALLRMTILPDLQHLVTSIKPGDVKGMYAKIFKRFCRLTPKAIQLLKQDLQGYSMASSGTSIEVYVHRLQGKHLHVLKVQQRTSDNSSDDDLLNMLLIGVLRPEFSAMTIYLQLQRSSLTFDSSRLS